MNKKTVLLIGALIVVALMSFILFNNKAEMERKANIAPITSIPVSVVAAAKQNIQSNLTQVGVIVAINDVNIVSEVSGKIITVLAKEGAYVSAGASIVKVDDTLLNAKYLASQTAYQKAQKDWERKQALYKDQLISDAELELARQTFKATEAQYIADQKQYQNTLITSPISGVVTSRPVTIGTMLNPGTVVANVVDISMFKVKVNVGEGDVFTLKSGDPVTIETDVYPGVKFPGRIDSISVKGDESHTYPVQVLLPNSKQYPLKSGMFGRVTFKTSNQNALVIPRDALVGSIRNPQVFVVNGSKAELRQIITGSEVGTSITVKKGLDEGDNVVISGQDNLRDGVTVAIQKTVTVQK
jgi:RND family efflux transporter MFP subunit